MKKKNSKSDVNVSRLLFGVANRSEGDKFLNLTGLSHTFSLIISFIKNYAAPKQHNHDASNITGGTISESRLPVISEIHGGTGRNNLLDAANDMIDSLSVGGVTPSDGDYLIAQVSGGGVAHKKPMTSLWSWIKPKCDALYQSKSAGDINAWKTVYPVGVIYASTNSTSPASLFGGQWSQITGDVCLMAGTSVGNVGSKKISVTQMPNHSHGLQHQVDNFTNSNVESLQSVIYCGQGPNKIFAWQDRKQNTYKTGNGQDYLPHSYRCYMWKRVA